MKKIELSLITILMLSILNPMSLKAATEVNNEMPRSNKTVNQTEADALVSRLYEINDMDKSTMSTAEKKELRNEVRSIKNQFLNNPVIIISGGALLLLIILLIILL